MSEWTGAFPSNVLDGHGTLIESASANPVPSCGCKDLVLKGTIEDENGKVFSCNKLMTINADGETVFTDDNVCILLCFGTHLWDLSCIMGSWSPYDLENASDISCYEETTTDGNSAVTLSTYWPPGKK